MLRKLVIITALVAGMYTPAAHAIGPVDALMVTLAGQSERFTAGEARRSRESGETIPARRARAIARELYPNGDILDVELVRDREPRFVVKVMVDNGRRIDVVLDARTGRVISRG
ncbi:PepSY domain-containing protein [Maricaulis sp.]|uniref:PepSY domain-containing protein n=1 Tax=Maricaulis sp. TaxID=1486257 RepID=UPI0026090D69|nr:PepSY domain-containing protein [Maricaulis sp.]